MQSYTAEFNEAWTRYGSPKNSSKSMAFKSWLKLGKERPEQSLILAEISCYNRFLAEEAAKTGRDYPKCHMATWLNQRRYDGFEDDARAFLRAAGGQTDAGMAPVAQGWHGSPTHALLDAADISGPVLSRWFWPTTYIPSGSDDGPPEIRSPSQFHRDELENRFGKVIRQAFGEDVQLTVAKKNGPGN